MLVKKDVCSFSAGQDCLAILAGSMGLGAPRPVNFMPYLE